MSRTVSTGIYCPHCSEEIKLRVGCRHERLLTAIHLQAERLGAEIHCGHCGAGFIYTRVRPHRSASLPGPHRVVSAKVAREAG
ncbi:MAG: hypothetical protein KDA93_06095 [Planctomycetaceae bacterium]|nr:hypothetical protein [Planctomycetaceae bacterium]